MPKDYYNSFRITDSSTLNISKQALFHISNMNKILKIHDREICSFLSKSIYFYSNLSISIQIYPFLSKSIYFHPLHVFTRSILTILTPILRNVLSHHHHHQSNSLDRESDARCQKLPVIERSSSLPTTFWTK